MAAALWYLVVSSFGPWALGAVMNVLGGESVWYRLAIYFYLHFLYNGWMIMALLGISFFILESHQLGVSNNSFKRFYWNINLGIILSFFLSTLFMNPPLLLNFLGGTGALLQLAAFSILLKAFTTDKEKSKAMFSPLQNVLLKTVAVLLGVKMLLQLITAFPSFANLATTHLDFTIGYLHWTFLGVVTLSLFLFLNYFGLLKLSKSTYYFYLIGFLITEALIFYKGIAAWKSVPLFDGYFQALAVGSIAIPIALFILLWNNLKPKAINF
ncbi:hypothetical protein ACA086_14590 [Muriicola sp. E247]|uniref:hypothetical protein n=1 Tax=Muriicola sp. E247 TaxID=3242730 RepID=UPI0035240F5E